MLYRNKHSMPLVLFLVNVIKMTQKFCEKLHKKIKIIYHKSIVTQKELFAF